MKITLFGMLMLTSSTLFASSYELDFTTVHLEHTWRGSDVADYKANISGVGLTYWHDTGFGLRVAHLFGDKMYTDGRYESYVIDLSGIRSLELMYRYELLPNLYGTLSIGTHKIHVPITSIEEDYYRNDSDDDEGYAVGLQYKVKDNWSVGYRFTHYGKIGDFEWTQGHSLNVTYRF